MTKGRQFAPKGDREGTWFTHRGADNSDAAQTRQALTSTGRMLSAPYTEAGVTQSTCPPAPFSRRDRSDYQLSNPFSDHDNRNYFQDHGVYFGNGQDTRNLGRRLRPIQTRLHHTGNDFLKHFSRNPVDHDYTTVSATTYTGRPTSDPPTYRRFGRKYGEPQAGRQVSLSTTSTDWFKEPPETFTSSTGLLAMTQKPFLKHNPWKFSYKSLDKVYPPFNAKRLPLVDNIFNRYGAAFTTSGTLEN